MERRIEIYNKIKNTKISKLTLKQNGESKTLNLKVDLLNEDVYLSDKALDMLENLANRQIALTEIPKISSSPVKSIPTEAFNSTDNNYIEPSVTTSPIYQREPTIPEDITSFESYNQIEARPVKGKEDSAQSQAASSAQFGFLCRLCLTKCPSERALHDHVTRIHGGSDARRKHYLFQNNSNYSAYDDNSDTNDELNNSQSDISITTGSNGKKLSENKKLKLMHQQHQKKMKLQEQQAKKLYTNSNAPKPNVAIRVAKVAYYNNKNSSIANSTNTNSKIFVNGIRGNFFSQERLPLKSCKIKLALNEASKQSSKMTTKLTSNEINRFFRSLLTYIPNEILTIDDLVTPNNLNDANREILSQIHSIILESREIGINLYNLKIKTKIQSMNLLMQLVDILLKNFLILSVGVCERVFVAHEFCQSWIILSYKNQKGCNYLSTSDGDQQQETNDALLKQKQYKKVWLVPRPWRYIDGLLNRQMLEKVFESIVLFLKMNPKATFETISLHYSPVLQPIMTLELLEMLEELNCVTSIRLKRESECNLESSFDHDSVYVLNNDDLLGNEISMYECNPDSIFILKQVFST